MFCPLDCYSGWNELHNRFQIVPGFCHSNYFQCSDISWVTSSSCAHGLPGAQQALRPCLLLLLSRDIQSDCFGSFPVRHWGGHWHSSLDWSQEADATVVNASSKLQCNRRVQLLLLDNCEAMIIGLINFPCSCKRMWYLSLPVPNCSALLHHTPAALHQGMADFQLGQGVLSRGVM